MKAGQPPIFLWFRATHRLLLARLCLGLLLFSASGCVTPGIIMPKDKFLLKRQKLKGQHTLSNDELSLQFVQRPNRRVYGFMPYVYFYYLGSRFYDRPAAQQRLDSTMASYEKRLASLQLNDPHYKKLVKERDRRVGRLQTYVDKGNWVMRTLGEPPVYSDTLAARRSTRNLERYLFNNGFFYARVRYATDTNKTMNRINVTYNIDEKAAVRIGKISHNIPDSSIAALVQREHRKSLLIEGDRWNKDKQDQEVERLFRLMRDNGYYGFSRSYIFIDNDTAGTGKTHLVRVAVNIENPEQGGSHKHYRISSATFLLRESEINREARDSAWYAGVKYITWGSKYSTRVLDTKMHQHPGEYYSQSKQLLSQAQLQGMDMFRFVNFIYDTTGGQLDIDINATKLPKYQISNELGLVVSAGAPGPYVNQGYKIRNPFNGFEVFEINGRYSEEGQIGIFETQRIFRARELGINASLTFPKFIPTGTRGYLFNKYSPRTRLLLGTSFVRRPEYARTISRGSLTYTITPGPRHQLGLAPIDLTLNFTEDLDPQFAAVLNQLQQRGNNLIQSFRNSLITGITSFYMYNTMQTGVVKRSTYFRLGAEFGGVLPHLLAQRYSSSGDSISVLKIFRYTRFTADFRYNQPIARRRAVLAMRLNAGVGLPWGRSKVLPWEKFFFSGGTNSIRAWPPRRLGPGSYVREGNTVQERYRFEQPGEMVLEGNIELRRKLFKYLEGALFLDAGNVWLLRPDASRPGAEFQLSHFWEQVAVGPGFGLRLDFSFVVIRFDVGIKGYDPSYAPGQRNRLRDISWRRPLGAPGQAVLNIGVGYPF